MSTWIGIPSPKAWGLDQYALFEMDKARQLAASGWPVIISLLLGYLFMVFFVKPVRTPYWFILRNVRQLWNAVLAIYSMIGSAHVMLHLMLSVVSHGLIATTCDDDESFYQGPTGFWFLAFVLGSIVQLGDTVFLLLSGRKILFLHWFHHATTLAWCWYELSNTNSVFRSYMALNYVANAFMYGYFALNDTFENRAFRKEWGLRVTIVQCTQFVLDLVVIAIAAWNRVLRQKPPQTSDISFMLSAFFATSYLVLLVRFAEEKYGVYTKFRRTVSRVDTDMPLNGDQTEENPFIMYPIRIAGIGAYLPKRVVYNEEIEERGGFKFTDAQKAKMGVRERRLVDMDGGENLVQNAVQAIRRACNDARVEVDDIDLIIGGFGGHQFIPDDAVLVQRELGLGESGVRAFTVHSSTLSFLIGMDVAGAFIRDGRYQCICLFASSTVAAIGVDHKDPHTAGLFGDGAAAVIIQPSDSASAVHRVHMETYGSCAEAFHVPGGGTFRHPENPMFRPYMNVVNVEEDGILSFTLKYVHDVLRRAMPGLENGLESVQIPGVEMPVDVDWVIPHQGSAAELDALARFGWPQDKVLKTISKYGNVFAASIPLTLWDNIEKGKIKRGDKVMLYGTAPGLSCAVLLFTY